VKREFAQREGLDFNRLVSMELEDRDYKESHRNALTELRFSSPPSLSLLSLLSLSLPLNHNNNNNSFFNEMKPSLQFICQTTYNQGLENVRRERGPLYFFHFSFFLPSFKNQVPASVVIGDVRHPLEIDWFRHKEEQGSVKVVTVRVTCTDSTRERRGWVLDLVKDSHITETALDEPPAPDGWDFVFENDLDGAAPVKRWANEVFISKVVYHFY